MSESAELDKLGELHQRGVLTDEEFVRAKARVLNGAAAASGSDSFARGVNALRRSRRDRWIGGVCGGIAELTQTASWLWRLLFTLLVLCVGTGVLVYVLLWIFVPVEAAPAPCRHSAA